MPKSHVDRPASYSYPVGLFVAAPAAPAEERPEGIRPPPPAASAPKPDWEAYAAAVGVDVAGLTKAQIRKAVA